MRGGNQLRGQRAWGRVWRGARGWVSHGARGRLWRGLALAGLAALCGGAECRRASSDVDFEVVAGRIQSVQPDIFALTVAVTDGAAGETADGQSRGEPLVLGCLLTNDTEIYVNDRFVGIEALRPGDPVELVGYRESGARGERFVVSLADIARPGEIPAAVPAR